VSVGKRGHGEGTAYRNRGRWAGAITVGFNREGDQQRRYVSGDTRREVLEKLDELRRQRDSGHLVATTRGMTVKDYFDEWAVGTIAHQVAIGELRESTADNYLDLAARMIVPYLGRHRLDELKPVHLREWLATLRGTTNARGRPFSSRTVQLAHAILRRALNDALRDELVTRNVALLVKAGRVTSAEIEPLRPEELRLLLAEAPNDRLHALWLLLISLGLRRGEALGLHWEDIDFDAKTLAVRRSLQRRRTGELTPSGRRRGYLVEVETKTAASVRTVALPDVLVEALLEHHDRQDAERRDALVWVNPSLVFTTHLGTCPDPRNVYGFWHALCDRAGVRRCRPHDLRHTAASVLLMQGADMRTVMEVLGHSRMATTSDLYTHVLAEVKADAATRMDAFLRQISSVTGDGGTDDADAGATRLVAE
jgi:integrase